jgi:putative restriction endonuclease
MRAYVAVTDGDWFRYLRDRPHLEEVNFWKPGSGSGRFRAVEPGELFLFKLHAQDGGAIAGGGTFMWYSRFPSWAAWEAFGEKNGAATFPEMLARIERYRREPVHSEVEVGCIIVRDPFFFEDRDWITGPSDWRPSTQQGKTYDLTSGIGRELWDAVSERWARTRAGELALPDDPADPMFREGIGSIRLGQGSFRLMVMDAYARQCAVTREKALPALQAAHIRPVKVGGRHQISNALLLRSDVHALYDHGYVTITPEFEFASVAA